MPKPRNFTSKKSDVFGRWVGRSRNAVEKQKNGTWKLPMLQGSFQVLSFQLRNWWWDYVLMRLLGFCFVGSCMEIQLLGSDSVHQNLLSVDDINPFGQLVRDSLGRGVLEQQISFHIIYGNLCLFICNDTWYSGFFGCCAIYLQVMGLSLIHIWRCRRYAVCRSRWSPYH